jgi:uncharacterized protein (TIGR00251 family)
VTKERCCAIPSGIRLVVQITPNARKTEVIGMMDDALKIRLQAQPIEGKANEALIRYLADAFKIPKNSVKITHGHTSRRKTVELSTNRLTAEEVMRVLIPLAGS